MTMKKEIQPCMTPGGKLLRKSTLTGDALCAALLLSLLITWNSNIYLGLRVSIMTLTTPHGSNVTNVIPPSICNVAPGSQNLLLRQNISCVLSTVADSFRFKSIDLHVSMFFVCPYRLNVWAFCALPCQLFAMRMHIA